MKFSLLLCLPLPLAVLHAQIEVRGFDSSMFELDVDSNLFRCWTTGDVDLDGYADLVTDGSRVLWGNADGFFDSEFETLQLRSSWSPPVIADFDGDDLPDIGVGSPRAGLWIYLNAGERRFMPPTIFDQDTGNHALDAVDVNRDGTMDLVSANRLDSGDLVWHELESPRPGRILLKETHPIATFNEPFALLAENLDSDEGKELVVSTAAGIYLLDWERSDEFPEGSFGEPKSLLEQRAVGRQLVAADLDQDGDLDLALAIRRLGEAQTGGTHVLWLRNLGNLSFSANILPVDSVGSYFRWIAASDLDGDGDVDLVASRMGAPPGGERTRLVYFFNDGSGNFAAHRVLTDASGNMFSFAVVPQPDGRTGILPSRDLLETGEWPIFLVPPGGIPQKELAVNFQRTGKSLSFNWRTERSLSYRIEFSRDLRSWHSRYSSGGSTFYEPLLQGTGRGIRRIIPIPDDPKLFFRVVSAEDLSS